MTLKSMLEKTVKQYAGKTAIVLGDRRVSYTELDEASNKVTNALIKTGVSTMNTTTISYTISS